MPPHRLMPHSIPRTNGNVGYRPNRSIQHDPSTIRRMDRHWPISYQNGRGSSQGDPYGAGFNGDVSRHAVNNPVGVKHEPKHFNEYIGPVDVIPGEPLLVIAELRGIIVTGEFVSQPAKTQEDTLILAAKARIGLNQEGFLAVWAGSCSLIMRVGNTGGLLQEVRVEMPPYDPKNLVVEYRKGLVIASA